MMMKKLLFFLLLVYLLIPLFDKNLYVKSDLEQIEINRRFVYFSNEMGVFYTKNKAMRFYLNKVFPIANKYFYRLAHLK